MEDIGWLWKTIVGPRVKVFLWQLLRDKLLVRSDPVKRGCNVFDICFLYNEVGKTALHVLITCQIVRDCWRQVLASIMLDNELHSFSDLVYLVRSLEE